MIGNIITDNGETIERNFPDPALFDAMKVQNLLFAPLVEVMGDKAPRCSMIGVDYKNGSGVDCSTYAVIMRPAKLTDEVLVKHIRDDMEGKGFELSGVHEYVEGEPPRLIYVKRSFFEETMMEMGVSIPKDLKGALDAFGYHPINLEDFA